MIEQLLTLEQVAEILQLSAKTVGEMIRAGELPALRLGKAWRVRPGSLEKWMEELEQEQQEHQRSQS